MFLQSILFLFLFTGVYSDDDENNSTLLVENNANITSSGVESVESKNIPLLEASPHNYGVHFYAFTNPEKPSYHRKIQIGNKGSLHSAGLIYGEPVYIYAHGFGSNYHRKQNADVKNVRLKTGQRNNIQVNWETTSSLFGQDLSPIVFASYFSSLSKFLPKACHTLTRFILFLTSNNFKIQDINLAGESLGAHLVGCAGTMLRRKYKMIIPQMVGLDPAGPFIELVPTHERLTKYSAAFVNVIHSNIDGFGIAEPIGDVDFYLNGGLGRNQPGCNFGRNPSPLAKIYTTLCAHARAKLIWLLTILRGHKRLEPLEGYPCNKRRTNLMCARPYFLYAAGGNHSEPIAAGELCPKSTRGKYYLPVSKDIIKEAKTSGISIVFSEL